MAVKTPGRTVVGPQAEPLSGPPKINPSLAKTGDSTVSAQEPRGFVDPNSIRRVSVDNAIVSSDDPLVGGQSRSELVSGLDTGSGRKVYNDSVAQVSGSAVNIQNSTPGNLVAVYTADDDIYVSNYEQNYTQQFTYTTETGVTQIIAGNNITITSSGPGGSGAVIINALGEEAMGTVSNITTTGSGLGFTLYGGPITTTGTIALQVPTATALRTNIGVGNIANLNLSGNGTQLLAGNGAWVAQPGITPPGGSNTQVQFNNAGGFSGSPNLTWNTSTSNLAIVGNVIATNATISNTGQVLTNKISSYTGEYMEIRPGLGIDIMVDAAADSVTNGGYAGMYGGDALAGGNANGGEIYLYAGWAQGGGVGGGAYLFAGPAGGANSTGGTTQVAGGMALGAGSTAGDIFVSGGEAGTTAVLAGHAYVRGGTSSNSAVYGGNVYIRGGYNVSNASAYGSIAIGDANTAGLSLGSANTQINFNGITNFTSFAQNMASISGATGVVAHDFRVASLFNHTSIASNFTVNLTNFTLATGKATNIVLVLNQGGAAYISNALQIGGVAQTINWQGGLAPDGNASKKDIVSFSIFSIGGVYTVFGQLIPFG